MRAISHASVTVRLTLVAVAALTLASCAPPPSSGAQPRVPTSTPPQEAPVTGTSQGPDEARFEGVISNIHFGATYDGHNTITVDGKRVIFDSGGLQDGAPQVKGRMIGFTFPRDIGSDDYAGLNGRTAEVYCRVFYASGPRMERIPVYSLFGSTRYYVRLK